jgi:DNA-binding CsgD family transcriptional regulator
MSEVELVRRYSKLPQPRLTDLVGPSRRARTPSKRRYRLAQRLGPDQIEQMAAGYRAGATTRELAEKYNVSKTAVTELLTARDVPLRHQGLSPSQVRDAIRLYAAGQSVAQAALSLSLSPSSVYDALKRSGVRMRPAHQSGRR